MWGVSELRFCSTGDICYFHPTLLFVGYEDGYAIELCWIFRAVVLSVVSRRERGGV